MTDDPTAGREGDDEEPPPDGAQSDETSGSRTGATDDERSETEDGDRSDTADGDRSDTADGDRSDTADGDQPDATDGDRSGAADADRSNSTDGDGSGAADGGAGSDDAAPDRRPAEASTADDEDGSFLGNLTSPRKQLGEAAAAFRNARGAGNLPRDDEDRVQLVCRRHAERRAVPLDDLGRPSCFDEDHPDCQGCLEDVRDGTVETW